MAQMKEGFSCGRAENVLVPVHIVLHDLFLSLRSNRKSGRRGNAHRTFPSLTFDSFILFWSLLHAVSQILNTFTSIIAGEFHLGFKVEKPGWWTFGPMSRPSIRNHCQCWLMPTVMVSIPLTSPKPSGVLRWNKQDRETIASHTKLEPGAWASSPSSRYSADAVDPTLIPRPKLGS